MARVVSLIVAVVTVLAGHALLFAAASSLGSGIGGIALPFFVAPFVVVGVLLIGVTALTAAWSSLGVFVVGVLEVVVGIGAMVLPEGAWTAVATGGAGAGDRVMVVIGPPVAQFWAAGGVALIEGALLLALGWSAVRRRRGVVTRPGIARVVSLLVTLVGLGPVAALALYGGSLTSHLLGSEVVGPLIVGYSFLALGLLLLVALMVATRWSGLGAIVWGAVLLAASLSTVLVTALVPLSAAGETDAAGAVTGALADGPVSGIVASLLVGAVAVVGAIFLFAGIASAIAGRTGHRRATYVQPPTGEVPEVGPRWIARPGSPD